MLTALMVLLRSIGLICGGHRAVVLENLALRQQLAVLTRTVKRPQLRSTDRLFWILLAKGWRDWRSALVVVQPDTVVRWHRQWLRRHWTRLSRRRHPGRPTTSSAIRAGQHDDHRESALGRAADARGIGQAGITVSERTVSRLLRRPRRPPSQTWRTFLTNHVATLVSMDFFTVPTLTGRVLFVLVLLSHQRRRIIHVNITEHPTAVWTAQQMMEAFPEDTAPRWLLHDHDAIYGDVPAPGRQPGHRRSDLRSVQPMAKSVCGEIDRIHHARVSEPRHRLRRAPSATSADRVSHLLSWGANTSRPGEGRADATTCSDADGGSRRRVPGSGRIASSLRTTRRLTRLGPTWRRRNRAVTSVGVSARRGRVRFPRRFNAIIFVMGIARRGVDGVP